VCRGGEGKTGEDEDKTGQRCLPVSKTKEEIPKTRRDRQLQGRTRTREDGQEKANTKDIRKTKTRYRQDYIKANQDEEGDRKERAQEEIIREIECMGGGGGGGRSSNTRDRQTPNCKFALQRTKHLSGDDTRQAKNDIQTRPDKTRQREKANFSR
jgi:hypothetical protein